MYKKSSKTYFGLLLLVTLTLSVSTGSNALEIEWSGPALKSGARLRSSDGNHVLGIEGAGAKDDYRTGVKSIYLPEGTFLSGNSSRLSMKSGTYSLWVRFPEFKDWDGILQTHIGFSDSGKDKHFGIGFKRISTGIVQAYSVPGGENILTRGGAGLDDMKPHHLVLTYGVGKAKDGKGARLYLDGLLVGASDYSNAGTHNKGRFLVGAAYGKEHAPQTYFHSLSYRDSMMSAEEVKADYDEGRKVYSSEEDLSASAILSNGGFEVMRSDRWARGWSSQDKFSISKTSPQAGEFCLQYENTDAKFYAFPMNPVSLEEGKRYRLTAWMRTENIEGPDSGACTAVEYYNAAQKYLGGTYTEGLKGTSEGWQKFSVVTNSIPKGVASCRVVCFVRRGMTGKAWWDSISVERVYDSLLKGISTDSYRNRIEKGDPLLVKVGINQDMPDGAVAAKDVSPKLALQKSDNESVVLKFARQQSERPDLLLLSVDTDNIDPGEYTLVCTASLSGGEESSISTPVAVLADKEKAFSYIDSRHRLIRDGKPFFPLGMYWGKVSNEELDIYAESDFNCLMPYAMLTKEEMDKAAAKNLKVIYTLKDCYFGTRWCPKEIGSAEEEKEFVAGKVAEFAKHPALLAWYINDERPVSMLERLTERQELLKKLDPDHPTWIVLCRLDDIAPLLPTCDIIGTDPYPVPDMPVATARDYARAAVRDSYRTKAVWMVPQMFNWKSYAKTEAEGKRFRAPTLQEMRSMAWQCIAEGANGLIFYSWFDVRKMDKVDPFEPRWKEIKQVAKEISDLSEVLLSDNEDSGTKLADGKDYSWRTFESGEDFYLLGVNCSAENASASFEFTGEITVLETVLGSARTDVGGKRLTLTQDGLEPVMLRCRLAR